MTKEEKLASIHNRITKYEAAAILGDRAILIAYCAQHSRNGLLRACRTHGQDMITALGLTHDSMMIPAPKASDGFKLGPWTVRFTGRTQRDAYMGEELPFVCDVARNGSVACEFANRQAMLAGVMA